MADIDIAFIMQICSIVAGAICVIFAIIALISYWSILSLCGNIFSIILGITCILIEVHIFDFFKYFTFLFTNWGKAAFYLFMAVSSFNKNWVGIVAFILFIVLAIFYLVIFIIMPNQRVNLPLTQKGGVSFSTTQADFS